MILQNMLQHTRRNRHPNISVPARAVLENQRPDKPGDSGSELTECDCRLPTPALNPGGEVCVYFREHTNRTFHTRYDGQRKAH